LPSYQGPYDLSKRLKHDNVYNKLNLDAGEIYRVRCDVWVEPGDELTIGPGTVLAFEGPYSVYVYGTVEVSGSPGNEVVFTSAANEPQRGDWRQIVLEEASDESFMEHVIIEYGSMDNRSSPSPDTSGALTVIACAPQLSNITIRDSYFDGLHCFNGANPVIDRLTINNIGQHGVVCELNSSPTITRSTVSNGGGYGFYLVDNSNPLIENLLVYNMNVSGFYVSGLSSPEINFATVYGMRFVDIGNDEPMVSLVGHGVHAVNYAKPLVKNSIFAHYEESGVLSEVSSRPDLQYMFLFSDAESEMFDGNVDTLAIFPDELTDELMFVNAAEFDFTLPADSPGKNGGENGVEVGAYGPDGNGM